MEARARTAPDTVRLHRELGSITASRAAEVLAACAPVIEAEVRNAQPALRYVEGLDLDDLRALARIAALEASLTFVEGRCAFRTWASRVIRWRLLETVRGAQRPPEAVELDEPCGGEPRAPLELTIDPTLEQDRDERFRWLQRSLAGLSPRRRALIAAKLRGESGRELSIALGVCDGRISQEVRVAVDTLHAAAVDAGLTDR